MRRASAVPAWLLLVVSGAAALPYFLSFVAWRLAAILRDGRFSLLLAGMDRGYYAGRLHTALLAWSVVLPLLAVCWWGIARCWGTLGASGSARPWRMVAPVLAVAASALLVPRYRTGDEPAYLLMADSLVTRGTFSSETAREEVHRSQVSRPEENRSVHGVGLSMILALPVRVLGNPGAAATTLAIAIACLVMVRRNVAETVGTEVADLVAGSVAVSFPLLTFAPLALPELAGALGFAVVLSQVLHRREVTLASAASVVALPWFHVRFLPGVAWLVLVGLVRVRSRRSAVSLLVVPLVASLVVMGFAHQRWFGSPWPSAMWAGRKGLIDLSRVLPGAVGLMVDQQYGLLVWAPLFLLITLGSARLWRRSPGEACVFAILAAVTVGPALLAVWYGGWSPAGRYLVPLLAPLAVLAALGLEAALQGQRADRVLAGAILAAQLGIGAICALLPDKVYGTMPEPARNYFLDLAQRLTHLDSRWILPAVAADGNRWPSVVHAAVLVATWLAASALWWGRLDRHAKGPRAERP